MRFGEFLFVQHSGGSQAPPFCLFPCTSWFCTLPAQGCPREQPACPAAGLGHKSSFQLSSVLPQKTLWVPERGPREFLAKICSFKQTTANIHSSSKGMELVWRRQKVWQECWRGRSKSFWCSGGAGSVWFLSAAATPDPSHDREVHVARPMPRTRNTKAIHTGESLGIQITDVRARI